MEGDETDGSERQLLLDDKHEGQEGDEQQQDTDQQHQEVDLSGLHRTSDSLTDSELENDSMGDETDNQYKTDDEELSDPDDDDDDDCDDEKSRKPSEANEESGGLVGLQNLGNTCYMNGALQALSNCQQLTRFILDCPGFLHNKGLSHSYSELIREIWVDRSSSFAVPTSIIRNVKIIYPAFRGCTQQDTQEFLRCFLEQLHDELKLPPVQGTSKPPIDGDAQSSDDTKKQTKPQVSNEGNHRSIISDTFEFRISSSVVCSSCNNVSTTLETFKDLSIPIPNRDHPYYQVGKTDPSHSKSHSNSSTLPNQVSRGCETSVESAIGSLESDIDSREIKNRTHRLSSSAANDDHDDRVSTITTLDSLKSQRDSSKSSYITSIPMAGWFWSWLSYIGDWFWGPKVKLQDCLSIFFGKDPLEGDNEYSCEVCTKKNKGVKFLKILELPEVLCIHFKRYESIGSAKITTHVSFPLVGLDLAPYMSEESKPQCTTYNLIACICHHGSAILTGHYTTYALNCYDEQWYEFDDLYVTAVSEYQVENSEAYILFYQKSTLDDRTDRRRIKASRLLKKSLSQTNIREYFISKQWVNKFNTFVEPGPITNYDFLCRHRRVPKSRQATVGELCHPISESVWRYLRKLHGGGPECRDLLGCEKCE